MARLETTAHTCDRCMGAQVIATVTRLVGVDGRRFRLDLCAEHDRLLSLNLGTWMRCATEEALGRPGHEPAAVAPVRPAAPVVLRRTEVLDDPEPQVEPVPVHVPDVRGIAPEVMLEWRFTKAASTSMEDRHIEAPAVWRAIQAPQHTEPGQNEGTEVWTRDGLSVVVNPSTQTVITVYAHYRRKTA